MSRVTASAREGWISGLVIGVVSGLASLVFPTFGLLVALVFAFVVSRFGGRLAAAGGFGLGFGSCWSVLLIRGIAACKDFDSVPGQGCTMPDLAPWLLIAASMTVVGITLTLLAIVRFRRNARGRSI